MQFVLYIVMHLNLIIKTVFFQEHRKLFILTKKLFLDICYSLQGYLSFYRHNNENAILHLIAHIYCQNYSCFIIEYFGYALIIYLITGNDLCKFVFLNLFWKIKTNYAWLLNFADCNLYITAFYFSHHIYGNKFVGQCLNTESIGLHQDGHGKCITKIYRENQMYCQWVIHLFRHSCLRHKYHLYNVVYQI